MNVKLKTKKLKSGRLSFYLSYYSPETQKRNKEYLALYLIDKPKNEFDRNHNKETKALAQKVYSKKLLEFQEGRFGFKTKEKLQLTFLSYFESIMEIKKRTTSKDNYSNWYSTHSHLKKFTRNSLKLSQIDSKYLNDLKEYLLSKGISRGGRKLMPNSAYYQVECTEIGAVARTLIHFNMRKHTIVNPLARSPAYRTEFPPILADECM